MGACTVCRKKPRKSLLCPIDLRHASKSKRLWKHTGANNKVKPKTSETFISEVFTLIRLSQGSYLMTGKHACISTLLSRNSSYRYSLQCDLWWRQQVRDCRQADEDDPDHTSFQFQQHTISFLIIPDICRIKRDNKGSAPVLQIPESQFSNLYSVQREITGNTMLYAK